MLSRRMLASVIAIVAIASTYAIALRAKAGGQGPEPRIRLTTAEWRKDFAALRQELPRRHANAFHRASPADFERAYAQLSADLPRLGDEAIVARLTQIVAMVGDGHTHLDLPPNWARYPLQLDWFGDSVYVVAGAGSAATAVGGRVVAVGDQAIDAVLRTVRDLVPRGENEGRTRLLIAVRLGEPVLMRGAGIADSLGRLVLKIERDGRLHTVIVAADARPAPASFRIAVSGSPPPSLQRLGTGWWVAALGDQGAAYFSFSAYPPEAEFDNRARELSRFLDSAATTRLVIDLRRNGGGDFTRFRRLLLPAIAVRRAALNGGVYVLIGPGTFSAAMVNALDLKRDAGATLVGMPTGQRPNTYREHGEFRLPHSQLRVSVSTRFYRFGADADTALVPDVLIAPTWDQFRVGRDSALEWALAKRPHR